MKGNKLPPGADYIDPGAPATDFFKSILLLDQPLREEMTLNAIRKHGPERFAGMLAAFTGVVSRLIHDARVAHMSALVDTGLDLIAAKSRAYHDVPSIAAALGAIDEQRARMGAAS